MSAQVSLPRFYGSPVVYVGACSNNFRADSWGRVVGRTSQARFATAFLNSSPFKFTGSALECGHSGATLSQWK